MVPRLQQRQYGTEPEEIVFGREIDWDSDEPNGGMVRISPLGPLDSGISPATARTLIERGFMSEDGNYGNEVMVAFGEDVQSDKIEVDLRGYMISPYREDARITLKSIHIFTTPLADVYLDKPIPRSVADRFRREFFPAADTVDERGWMGAYFD
jgi:hypothetical protein